MGEEKKENKLYSLLAIMSESKKDYNTFCAEIEKLFDKSHKFAGDIQTYTPYDPESTDLIPVKETKIVSTVKEKLDYFSEKAIEIIDLLASIEESNTCALGELEVDGIKFGSFSGPMLLGLEKQINRLIEIYGQIPTLDNAINWYPDKNQGEGYYRSDNIKKYRKISVKKVMQLAPATKEHKEQAEIIQADEVVGMYDFIYKSGAIPSGSKAKILSRLSKLRNSIAIARSKANTVGVVDVKIGKKIFDYIHKDLI